MLRAALAIMAVTCVAGRVGLVGAQDAAPIADPANDTLPAEVVLEQLPCDKPLYAADRLAPLVRMELTALGVTRFTAESGVAPPAGTPASPSLAWVRVECGGEQDVLLRVADLATKKEVRRSMSMADVAEPARPRAIAIAVVELLESSWSELAAPAPGETPLPAAIQAKLRARLTEQLALGEKPAEPLHPVRPLQLALLTRVFPTRNTGLFGARLGAALALGARPAAMALGFDVESAFGAVDLQTSQGRVGSVDFIWLSAGARLSFQSHGATALSIGPSVRVAYVIANAHTQASGARATDARDVVGSVGGFGELRFELSRHVAGVISTELGYMIGSATLLADTTRVAGISDVSVALALGLAVGWE